MYLFINQIVFGNFLQDYTLMGCTGNGLSSGIIKIFLNKPREDGAEKF